MRLHSAIHVECSGKYRTEDKLKILKIHKLNTTQETRWAYSITLQRRHEETECKYRARAVIRIITK